MLLIGFSIAAYFLDFSRFYVYGLLAGRLSGNTRSACSKCSTTCPMSRHPAARLRRLHR
jgi:hypothetical protein